MHVSSVAMEKIIATVTLGVAFLVMASIFVPHTTQADDHSAGPAHGPAPGPEHHAAPAPESSHEADLDARRESTNPHEGLGSLGTIEGDLYLVHIYATDLGPRYSIYDRHTAEELGVLLSADKVQKWFPDLPLPSMEFDGQPIMHADVNNE